MNIELINKFLRKVNYTEEEEISCSVCFERVSAYVERKKTGKERPEDTQLRQHLVQCDVCQEEAEVLQELFQLIETEEITGKIH